MAHPTIVPIGVQDSGEPAAPPVSYGELARMAKRQTEGPVDAQLALDRDLADHLVSAEQQDKLGEIGEMDRPKRRNAADPDVGWGIVFHEAVSQEVRDALEPLRQHRNGRPALPDWEKGETFTDWLYKQDISRTNRETEDLPYYLLLVGRPDQIPFAYQYELGRMRAVGRLDLGDDPAPYRAYGEAVKAWEENPPVARRALFAAARNGNDKATNLSADHLMPALSGLPTQDANLQPLGYVPQYLETVQRDQLMAAVRPDDEGRAPAFVFLSTHGVRLGQISDKQLALQGAWLCSDWQGGAVPRQAYLTAEDVGPQFYAPGSIIFSMACFGLGTSQTSEYAQYYNLLNPKKKLPTNMAARSFVAALPRRLLTYQQDGEPASALAVVGHVDLSWTSSFWDPDRQQADVSIFGSFARRLLEGDTVGMALEKFVQIANDYNTELSQFLGFGKLDISNEKAVGKVWIDRNNAQGFIVLGDPAVRIEPEKLKA